MEFGRFFNRKPDPLEVKREGELPDNIEGLAEEHISYLEGQHAEDIQKTKEQHKNELQKAETDGLTGLNRREVFDRVLEQELENVRTGATKVLSVIMLDLDHFKSINDTYGHLMGDEVIKRAAKLLRETVRPSDVATVGRAGEDENSGKETTQDVAGRWGGEELIVVLPGASSSAAVKHAIEL